MGPFLPGHGPTPFRPNPFGSRTLSTIVTGRTIGGVSRALATTTQTISGKSYAVVPTTQTIPGRSRAQVTPRRTIPGKSRARAKTLKTLTGKSRAQAPTLKTLTGKSRARATTLKTVTGKSRARVTTVQNIYGRSRSATANLAIMAPGAPGMVVSYGNFVINESNGCILASEYVLREDRKVGSFYCEFNLRLTDDKRSGNDFVDDVIFAAMVANLETTLRIPRQRLQVLIRGTLFLDRDFYGHPQTAITIEPELILLEENSRDYRYGLRVVCGFLGNVPGNFFRRDSMTMVGLSLSARRTCAISAEWTGQDGVTAYNQYNAARSAFYTQYLPTNLTDQFGNIGEWVVLSEKPSFNDENSLAHVSAEFWEVFAGRRESLTRTITVIDNLRVCQINALFAATANANALQNFQANGDAFFGTQLPTDGNWVKVSSDIGYVDNVGTLQVSQMYHEINSNGLRDFKVNVTRNQSGIRAIVVSGVFYATPQAPARANYNNSISAIISQTITAEGGGNFENFSVPKVTGYDTTGLRYFFTWTLNEIPFPQSSVNYDDLNVGLESIHVNLSRPFDAQAMTVDLPVTRLQVGTVDFDAFIDINYPDGLDPLKLWDQRLRNWALLVMSARLSAPNSLLSIIVVDEQVGHIDAQNHLKCRLTVIVTGGGILTLHMSQSITQVPGLDLVGMGDGTPFDYEGFWDLPEKILHREARCEYVIDAQGTPPTLFDVGDNLVSGFTFIDTGMTAQESVDMQNTRPFVFVGPGWIIDRRAGAPLLQTNIPVERGDGAMTGDTTNSGKPADYKTNRMIQSETWRYANSITGPVAT